MNTYRSFNTIPWVLLLKLVEWLLMFLDEKRNCLLCMEKKRMNVFVTVKCKSANLISAGGETEVHD